MTRLLRVDERASDEDWDRIVAQDERATVYQTRTWAAICEHSFANCRGVARLYTFDDGTEILLPGAVQTAVRGTVKVFKSAYPFDLGGPVSAGRVTTAQMEAISSDLRSSEFSSVFVCENPFKLAVPLGGFARTDEHTHLIPLEDGLEGVKRRSRSLGQQWRRSERLGVVVEERNDEYGVCEFYRLYLKSVERWGETTTWLRPFEFLEETIRYGGPNVSLRLAMLEGQPIGGQVDYLYGKFGHLAWRAFDYDYRSFYPNAAVLASSLENLYAKGVEYYDLGPSSGLSGVEESKERSGGVPVGYRIWQWESPSHRAYRTGRRALERAQAAVRTATHR
jgi:hypothetical protein